MRKRLLFYIVFISLGLLVTSVNAQVTTDLLFSDTDTLAGGYYVRYQYDIDYSDSSIRIDIDASEPLDFGICNGGEMEDWQNGGSEPSWYVYRTNVTLNTITSVLDRGTYDFVLINWGSLTSSYDITVYASYDPSSNFFSNNITTIIIVIVAVFAAIGITALMRSRRRKAAPPIQYQTQTQPYQSYTQQPTQYQPPSTDQTMFESKPKGMQICPNCGADEDMTTKFCTNCGTKLQ